MARRKGGKRRGGGRGGQAAAPAPVRSLTAAPPIQGGVSTTVPATTGARRMLDPITAGAIAKTGSEAIGGVFDAMAPQIESGITEADRDRAIDTINTTYGTAADIAREGFSIAGQDLSLSTKRTKEDKRMAMAEAAKAEALARGRSERQAEKYARRVSQGDISRKQRRRFKDFLRDEGEQYGLSIDATGRISMPSVIGGGFDGDTGATQDTSVEDANLALQEGLVDVAPDIAADVKAGLGFRSGIRDYFAGMMPGMDDQGLTAQDRAELDATRALGMRNVQERFRDDLQRTTGGLMGRGFMSSSLAGQALQRGAFDPYSRNLVDLEASQASQAEGLRTGAANRRSQSIRNILGMEAGLGGASAAPITSAFVSPAAYGGFTDPQAFQAALAGLQTSMGLYTDKGKAKAGLFTQPYYQDMARI